MDDNLIERRREAFELYMENIIPSGSGWFERDKNSYLMPTIEARWQTWNAALDSAVVELPDVKEAKDIAYFNADVVDAIERAGLRVKS